MRIGYLLESACTDGTVRFVFPQAAGLTAELHLLASALRACCAAVAAAGSAFPSAVKAAVDSEVFLELLANDLFVGKDPDVKAAMTAASHSGRVFTHSYDDDAAQAWRYGLALADLRLRPLPVGRRSEAKFIERRSVALDDEIFVLTAARLDADHVGYVHPLIQADGVLRRGGANLRLVLVGGGAYADAICAELPDFVTYLGFRTDLDSRLEAALAGVSVISSCTRTHPEKAQRALSVYGLHSGTLHCYVSTSITPPIPFEKAIASILEDNALRELFARRGMERVRETHGLARYIAWLERYLSGEDADRCEVAPVDSGVRIPVRSGVSELLPFVRFAQEHRNVGLSADVPVAWSEFATLPEDCWDAAADATRRAALTFAAKSSYG